METLVKPSFWKGKRVFLTGHTGFKGSWMSRVLINYGAELTGYGLLPPTTPNLFSLAGLEYEIHSIIGDIRDLEKLSSTFDEARPEIVIHMAAQPIVRNSYEEPRYTYETNVMGTVNLLECIRKTDCVKSFINVTTDKVYKNNEWEWGYREIDPLDGFDPYSNSKSCSEIVTHSYKDSFLRDRNIAVSTARAGNVIGGGDFAKDRIIPDCIRAVRNKEIIAVRNPYSTRPYQHVMEPVMAYLMITELQYNDILYAGWYNIGPDDCDCVTTGHLVDLFCSTWGNDAKWENRCTGGPHEANFLKLDCSKIKNTFGWHPRWHINDALAKTCEWTKEYFNNGNIQLIMDEQIKAYEGAWL
ncbi:MAG: CDP-glucose 4,6-dehydratase [Synergistaceae bacterium]